jgi:transposase
MNSRSASSASIDAAPNRRRYAPGRSGQYAEKILKGFSGVLQVDGYAGYNRMLKRADQSVQLAYCWAHARRKLHEVAGNATAPIAEEGLKQIAALYRIEKDIRGQSPEARLAARQEHSAPKIAAFETWLHGHRARVSAKSPLGKTLKYIAKYWNGLTFFLVDGRI